LLSPEGQKRLKDLMSGNAITRLTLKKIKAFPVAIPLFAEQEQIAERLEGMRTTINSTECELEKLQQLKSGMLTDLLTGRVRVPEIPNTI
jgi:type I restriction enzyme S subunit